MFNLNIMKCLRASHFLSLVTLVCKIESYTINQCIKKSLFVKHITCKLLNKSLCL